MDKNKRIITVLMILTIVFTITGGTLAYWSWRTTDAQKTNITFTITSDFSCSADGGGDITSGSINLVPTVVSSTTTGNYIKREVKVTPTINTNGKTIYMDLWLDINRLDSGLSNSVNFKYAFTTSSTSNTTGVITSGNFNGKKANDKVILLRSKDYTSTTMETYYLWIWLDAEETSSETMDQSFSLSLNGSCTDKSLPYSEDILNGGYPQLDDGMIPVVFDASGSNTIVKTVSNTSSDWYDYSRQEWANAVLVKENGTKTRAYYKANPGVAIDESDILAYYVWIPRYSYKIWETGTSANGKEKTIDIQFESADTISTGTTVGSYITHPAFWWDNNSNGVRESGEELAGIWVGKFETTGTADSPTILPDVVSLRLQRVSLQFATAQKLGGTTYGVSSSSDSHMMKNSEWGAVAYLSHSKYGANREIYINNSSSYYTGRSGGNVGGSTAINTVYTDQTSTTKYNSYGFYTWDGFLLNYNTNTKSSTRDLTKVGSTTGNMTGVYDMSGGAQEYVMGWYSGASDTFGSTSSSNFAGFTSALDSKYWDEYTTTNALTACNGEICYGHGLSEINNWYGTYAFFVDAVFPWFKRDGDYFSGVNAGVFGFSNGYGNGGSSCGFRSVLSFVGA